MFSMLIVTTIYVLVAVAAIGARPWGWFDGTEAALVKILEEITGQPWMALVFAVGAVLAIASIVLTVLYGQTRILLSMSRDGLVPKVFGRVSPRTGTPAAGTLIVGTAVALTAGLVPLGALADATSIGTLFAFALVNVAVIYLRRTRPELTRTFRVPLFPLTPILGALMCAYLMANLGAETWVTFGIWMLVGWPPTSATAGGTPGWLPWGTRNTLNYPAAQPATTPTPQELKAEIFDDHRYRTSGPPVSPPLLTGQGAAPVTMLNPDFPFSYDHYLSHPEGLGSVPPELYGTEVAVVGAGLSGLVTAYELMKLGLRPVLYEADQIGGRLRTASFPSAAGRRGGPGRDAFPGIRQGLLPLRRPAGPGDPGRSPTRWRRRPPAP